jgi:hypothetical protein
MTVLKKYNSVSGLWQPVQVGVPGENSTVPGPTGPAGLAGPTGAAGPIYPLTVSLLLPTGGNDGDVWMVYS